MYTKLPQLQILDKLNQKLDENDVSLLTNIVAEDKNLIINWLVSFPLPAWVKCAKTQRMLYINPAMCKRYDLNGAEYLNKTFVEVWGDDSLEYYQSRDKLITELGTPLEYFDTDLKGNRIQLLKWAVYDNNKKPIYLCGVILNYKNKILSH